MLHRMVGSPGGLGSADLRPFDDAISAPLPTDYREFVARYNGGQPRPSWIRCRLRGGLEYLPVDSFLPLDTPAALRREVAALSALPTGGPTFPIADSGEDVFVMTVGRGTSPVYYFQSADHVPEYVRLGEGLFPVADSFGQLLDRLEYHPESKPWLEYICTGNYEAFRRWVQSADPAQRRISVCSPIEEAAIMGDVEAVRICLQHAHPSATALRYFEGDLVDPRRQRRRVHLRYRPCGRL